MQHGPRVDLFSETFGHKKNPVILLNAGAGGQCISWPDVLCQALADRDYRVIRYDYRDTGLSSAIDYDTYPYTSLDLAKDAVQVLRHNHVQKAHCAGFSMGGQIIQIMAAHFSEVVQSLILVGTSSNFQPGFKAFAGEADTSGLSAPDRDYVEFAKRPVEITGQSLDERVDDYVKVHRLLDGNPPNFNEAFFRAKGLRQYTRTTQLTSYKNHAKAMEASFKLHEEALEKIQAPTLILHGKKDPVFPVDHGIDMARRIKNSKLEIWENFAHSLSPQHHTRIVDTIDSFIKKIS